METGGINGRCALSWSGHRVFVCRCGKRILQYSSHICGWVRADVDSGEVEVDVEVDVIDDRPYACVRRCRAWRHGLAARHGLGCMSALCRIVSDRMLSIYLSVCVSVCVT